MKKYLNPEIEGLFTPKLFVRIFKSSKKTLDFSDFFPEIFLCVQGFYE